MNAAHPFASRIDYKHLHLRPFADGTTPPQGTGMNPTDSFLTTVLHFPLGSGPETGIHYPRSLKPNENAIILSQSHGPKQGYKNQNTGEIKYRGADGVGGYDSKFSPDDHTCDFMADASLYGTRDDPWQKVYIAGLPVILATRERPGVYVPATAARPGHTKARQYTIFHAMVVDGSIEDAEFEGKPTIKFKIRLVNADDTYPINYPWMYEQAAPAAAGVAGAAAAA